MRVLLLRTVSVSGEGSAAASLSTVAVRELLLRPADDRGETTREGMLEYHHDAGGKNCNNNVLRSDTIRRGNGFHEMFFTRVTITFVRGLKGFRGKHVSVRLVTNNRCNSHG